MSSAWFQQQLAKGLAVEDAIADLLGSKIPGLKIVQHHARSSTSGGPRVRSLDAGILDLPAHDFGAKFGDKHFEIQIKYKTIAAYFHHAHDYQHGIDTPVFENYERQYRLTGTKCWLIFVEGEISDGGPEGTSLAPKARAQWLHKIGPAQKSKPQPHALGGMSNWRVSRFVPILDMTMSPPEFLREGDTTVAHMELRREFFSKPELALEAPAAKPARQRCGFCQQKLTRDHLSLYLDGRWFHQGQCFDAAWFAHEAAAMADYPALMLWTDAYLGDAYHLSTEEHGAYFLLLIAAWRTPECRLPDDDHFLARVTKSTIKRWREKLRPAVAPFWDIINGYWTQKRLLREREKAETIRSKRSRAGNASVAAKRLMALASGSTHEPTHAVQRARATPQPHPVTPVRALPPTLVPVCNSEPSPNIVRLRARNGTQSHHRSASRFADFWMHWTISGTKRGRADAERRYDAAIKSGVEHETLCAGVDRYMAYCRRERKELQYIKLPATWLNKGCWDDELSSARTDDNDEHWGLYS